MGESTSEPTKKFFIGIDIGTECVRAGLFNQQGELLDVAKRAITLWTECEFFEQSSEQIWKAICACVQQITVANLDRSKRIGGIGYCATCSLVVVDKRGEPLPVSNSNNHSGQDGKKKGIPVRNVILWMDHRAECQANRINKLAADSPVLRYVGGQISPEMQTPKLLWLKENRRDTFERAGHFFDLSDFATWKATGSVERSICTLFCKWTYLAVEQRWDEQFFCTIGLPEFVAERFQRIGQRVCRVGTAIGTGLSEQAAREFGGIPAGIPVAASLIDAHAGALGTLCLDADGTDCAAIEQKWALILGTFACTMNLTRKPCQIPGVWGPYFGAVWPNLWLNEGGISAFGIGFLKALKMHPGYNELKSRLGIGSDQQMLLYLEAIAGPARACSSRVPPNLHLCPEFMGNRSPHADPAATASIVGIRIDAMSGEEASVVNWLLAVLASLCYGLREILDQIEAHMGQQFKEIVVSGGMCRNGILLQLLADITQKEVRVPACEEPVLLGAVVLAAVAGGQFDGCVQKASNEMVRKWVQLGQLVEPQREHQVQELHARKVECHVERICAMKKKARSGPTNKNDAQTGGSLAKLVALQKSLTILSRTWTATARRNTQEDHPN